MMGSSIRHYSMRPTTQAIARLVYRSIL
jgi:hypothetical protein